MFIHFSVLYVNFNCYFNLLCNLALALSILYHELVKMNKAQC